MNQDGECTQRVSNALTSFQGKSLKDARTSINQFLTDEVLGKDVILRYQYPNILLVYVTESKASYALSNTDETDFRLIDRNGYAVSSSSETTLPYARSSKDLPQVGESVSNEEMFVLGILADLHTSYRILKGNLEDDGFVIDVDKGTTVLFPLEGDREMILGSFVLVMNQLNTGKTSSTMDKVSLEGKTVDLRFKNPVIR